MDLIGKTVWYKPTHEREMKKAVVVSSQTFCNVQTNSKFTLLTMDNGDKESPGACYMEESEEEMVVLDIKPFPWLTKVISESISEPVDTVIKKLQIIFQPDFTGEVVLYGTGLGKSLFASFLQTTAKSLGKELHIGILHKLDNRLFNPETITMFCFGANISKRDPLLCEKLMSEADGFTEMLKC
ncbi:MAG: hypothetical protein HQK65_07550 [Desulfamplus sp.]|nr:hypothetical protein [Desulfamplus sp.]